MSDVSGQPVSPTLKHQGVQEEFQKGEDLIYTVAERFKVMLWRLIRKDIIRRALNTHENTDSVFIVRWEHGQISMGLQVSVWCLEKHLFIFVFHFIVYFYKTRVLLAL